MSPTPICLYHIITAVLITVSQSQRFINPPKDVAAIVGSEVALSCEVELGSDYLEWVEYITDPGGRRIFLSFMNNLHKYIDDTHPWKDRYHIKGNYNLLIKNVTWADAGRYRCRMLLSDQHGEAELITLGHTKCRSHIEVLEGSKTTLDCSIKFNRSKTVKRIPHLQWYNGHYRLSGPMVVSSSHVRHSVDFIAHADDDGKMFKCKSFFEAKQPKFSSECRTKLKILYSPRNIRFSPLRADYLPAETISCSADGNPAPRFSWQRVSGNSVHDHIYGSLLILSKHMAGNNTYRCTASNVINGEQQSIHRDFNFNVFIPYEAINGGAKRTSMDSTSGGAVVSVTALYLLLPLLLTNVV